MDEAGAARLVLAEREHDRRIAVFSALLARESGLGTGGLTVVGGSAIEIYTGGRYVSGDLDLVVDSREKVARVLRRWGFKDEAKFFTKTEWGIFADVMQTRDSGSARLTQVVDTRVGPFRITGIEDLLLRRVRESVAWQGREEAFEQARLLAGFAGPATDWGYLEFYAKREGWQAQLVELRRAAGGPKAPVRE
jgi:hypothetical protein